MSLRGAGQTGVGFHTQEALCLRRRLGSVSDGKVGCTHTWVWRRVMMDQISVATVCVQVALQTWRMVMPLSRAVLILCSVHTGASREYS